jgi:osmotically-inducible protein OsmY
MTGVKIPGRTGTDIQQDVLDELEWDSRVRPNEVGVSVKDGIVTLSGPVDSYTKRWAAEEAALRVVGVQAIANDFEVHLPSAAERTDTELAQAALSALKWDADIPADGLEVTVSHGRVTLKGTVDDQFQRAEAERVVRRLAGVKAVTNWLTVRVSAPAPQDIKQRIERALVRNAETDANRVSVEVLGHTVVLRGDVRSWAERRAAEGSAGPRRGSAKWRTASSSRRPCRPVAGTQAMSQAAMGTVMSATKGDCRVSTQRVAGASGRRTRD